MTPEEAAIIQSFIDEYLRVCKIFIMKADAHPEYINAHNLIHPEAPLELQHYQDPFASKKEK